MSTHKWFQELLNEETGEKIDKQDLDNAIKTTLLDLYNAGSTLVFEKLIQSTWVCGKVDIDAEIFYFEMLSPLWEKTPSLLDRRSKKKKQQVSKQKQAAKRPEIEVDNSSSDNRDALYVE